MMETIQQELFCFFLNPSNTEKTNIENRPNIDKFETKLIPREVSRFLNVTERTVSNFKLRRIKSIELSDRKHFFLEKDVLNYVNKNYYPAQILGEDILLPLTIKDKLLSPLDVIEFFRGNISRSTIGQYRNERKLGYVRLSETLYRYPERDLLAFTNNGYRYKMSYEL